MVEIDSESSSKNCSISHENTDTNGSATFCLRNVAEKRNVNSQVVSSDRSGEISKISSEGLNSPASEQSDFFQLQLNKIQDSKSINPQSEEHIES